MSALRFVLVVFCFQTEAKQKIKGGKVVYGSAMSPCTIFPVTKSPPATMTSGAATKYLAGSSSVQTLRNARRNGMSAELAMAAPLLLSTFSVSESSPRLSASESSLRSSSPLSVTPAFSSPLSSPDCSTAESTFLFCIWLSASLEISESSRKFPYPKNSFFQFLSTLTTLRCACMVTTLRRGAVVLLREGTTDRERAAETTDILSCR
mmetsp:Transcript_13375/g.30645  ORF Transcript_13375/g.30645 Transcript_13375/m.30645 type:complete len:207 (+) Transcript_13375:45-665(+)